VTTFYWYDLETSGTASRWDRITQFAGLRTDAELNETGEVESFHVRLPDDVLPNPDAALVTGLTPQMLRDSGVSEWTALRRINALFAVPGTCTVGFNTLRFDDEFVRHGLYRNLMDPYAREFRNGNSRWDIMDLVRATGALRREGLEWPVDQEGLPVYRLGELTRANGIEHGQAHDALSDACALRSQDSLITTSPCATNPAFARCLNRRARSSACMYPPCTPVPAAGLRRLFRWGATRLMRM
jgi:exodeoxyribonuclease-1